MFEDVYSLAKKNIQDENYKQAKDNLLKCLNFKPSFDILHLLGAVSYTHLTLPTISCV